MNDVVVFLMDYERYFLSFLFRSITTSVVIFSSNVSSRRARRRSVWKLVCVLLI